MPNDVIINVKADDNASGSLSAISKRASALGDVLKTASVVGIGALAGLGVAAFKIGSDFDSAYDRIRISTGATGDVLDGLQKDFKAVFGAVPTDMASASTAIADLNTRLGLTGEPLQTLSKQILEMSRITGTDLGSNIATVTRAFGDWSISTEDMSGAMDTLFKVSQATGPSVDEIGRLVVQYGAPLRQFGFSFEEAATLMGQFQKQGVNTELVMGSLRIAIGNFAKDNIPLRKGLEDTIKKIQEMGPSAQATALAMEVFGARAGADMADTILSGKFAIEDWVQAVKDSNETILGAAAQTADFGEKFTLMKNQLLLALEPLTAAFFSMAGQLVERLTPALAEVAKWLEENIPKAVAEAQAAWEDMRPTVEMLWDAFKTGLDTIMPLLKSFTDFIIDHKPVLIAAMAAIGAAVVLALGPVSAATLALVGIITLVGLLRDNWDMIKAKTEEVWGDIKNFLADNWQEILSIALTVLLGPVGLVALFVTNSFGIRDKVTEAFESLKANVLGKLEEWRNGVVTKLTEWGIDWPLRMGAVGRDMVKGIWDGIASLQNWLFGQVEGFAKGIFGKVKSGLGKLWPGSPSEAGRDIATGLGAGIVAEQGGTETIAEAFGSAIAISMNEGMVTFLGMWAEFVRLFHAAVTSLIPQVSAWGHDIGYTFAQGVAAGITAGQNMAVNAAVQLVQAAEAAARAEAQTASPSKLFAKIGQMVSAGFAIGMERGLPQVAAAGAGMVQTAAGSVTNSHTYNMGGVTLSFPSVSNRADAEGVVDEVIRRLGQRQEFARRGIY